MTDPDMDALRDEYRMRPDRVGPLIFGEVRRAARLGLRRGPREDAVDDLVQETFAGALLGENQLDYIMDVASNLDEFRRAALQARPSVRGPGQAARASTPSWTT